MTAVVDALPTAVADRAALVADRAALARAVLARAERDTGATPVLRAEQMPRGHHPSGATSPRTADHVLSPVPTMPKPPTDPGPPRSEALPGVERFPSAERFPGVEALPAPAGLASLLPGGGLRRGSTVVVEGATSVLLALLAEASRQGAWAAVVGLPELGLLAASQTGVVLGRLALVPEPAGAAADVVAAMVDGMDLVVLGRRLALTDADRRRLSARVRERRGVLLSVGPWAGAQVRLSVRRRGWEGVGRGEGRLRAQRLLVTRGGRAGADRTARVEMVLPAEGAEPGHPVPVRSHGAGRAGELARVGMIPRPGWRSA